MSSIGAMIGVEIPYGLRGPGDLVLEPDNARAHRPAPVILEEWLKEDPPDDEIERVLRATVLLHGKTQGADLSACLDTALTWERG